jgi:endonuclease/exonuclease/phosphatase family metal-dependent hydrolase
VETIRVATFNIRHCLGTDGRVDVDRVAEVILRTGAGIIALQEVDNGMARSDRVDQATRLGELTGLNFRFHETLRRRGGRFGLAFASREDAATEMIRFPRAGSEEPRGAIVAHLARLTVISTHLSAAPGPRPAEIEALAELAVAHEGRVLVMGDLNAPLRALTPLTQRGFVPTTQHVTLPGRPLRRHIDHIFAGPGLTQRSSKTLPTDASDHRPLVANLSVTDDAVVKY